mmetsp:Transcript_126825/g.394755  ORF Transcript_126825/g.394755 Transcript_126825/m.394755 type:complete len:200 (-) Transcript_126825:431-1030(-)
MNSRNPEDHAQPLQFCGCLSHPEDLEGESPVHWHTSAAHQHSCCTSPFTNPSDAFVGGGEQRRRPPPPLFVHRRRLEHARRKAVRWIDGNAELFDEGAVFEGSIPLLRGLQSRVREHVVDHKSGAAVRRKIWPGAMRRPAVVHGHLAGLKPHAHSLVRSSHVCDFLLRKQHVVCLGHVGMFVRHPIVVAWLESHGARFL